MQVTRREGRRARHLWAVGAVAVGLLAMPAGALADDGDPPWVGADEDDDGWGIGGGQPGDGNDDDAGEGGWPDESGDSDDEPATGSYWSRLGPGGEDGDRCWDVFWREQPDLSPGDGWTYEQAYDRASDWDEDYPRCPSDEETPDPTGEVHAVWAEAALLPPNELVIDPGGQALTGLPAFLEIEGERTLGESTTLPEPFSMEVTFDASAEYEVAWGDGTPLELHASTGGPYPDGDITHTYAEAEDVEVVVTARWSGTWSAGEFSGALPVIEREHSLPLEVNELQSVRTSNH